MSWDDISVQELHEATAGLGSFHDVDGCSRYLANREECLACLKDLHIALKRDGPQNGFAAHLRLGDWKVVPKHLIPLLESYREDRDITNSVLRVLVQLTTRCELAHADQVRHLEHLQDYKEAFGKKDVFIILMGKFVENMEEDDVEGIARSDRAEVFGMVLSLLRHLVCIPDPGPGDPGYTPMRRNMQLAYIRHLQNEGALDLLLLLADTLATEQDCDQRAWSLADIVYHICAHTDPEVLTRGSAEKDKGVLKELLAREEADLRLRVPPSSRHARFGTLLELRTSEGSKELVTSVLQGANISKGGAYWRREFHDPGARSEKKTNVFHDPFFVDLEEGSVRDHNQLNPHVKQGMEAANSLSDEVLQGLRKFFEEFLMTSFSSVVHLLRSSLGPASASLPSALQPNKPPPSRPGGPFDRPKLLNFLSWFLEFHRHYYGAVLAKAKRLQQTPPVVDIASVQGAIDLDMIQFTAARLREYGKGANMHPSMIVMTLRALAQQVKTIDVVIESKDADTRDCGEILTQNIVKDNVMSNLGWVMKNFKSSSHDPRILSYAVEVFHYMLRLMRTLQERKGQKLEFVVESSTARTTKRDVTTIDLEIENLADARVIENLFYLLEKYKRHSLQLGSMLAKLIYAIIRVRRENIVVFFELSYFMRIQRIMADPIITHKKHGKRYEELVKLLQHILRQFFKCAETNGCVFVELLFRKVPENQKESPLESRTAEFAAILDNYETEDYSKVLERMRAGETLGAIKSRQRALLEGTLPWSPEEDDLLRQKYPIYSEHPLCAELLAAELPEENQRTGAKVRKRLVELGLVMQGQRGLGNRNQSQAPAAQAGGDKVEDLFDDPAEPAAKRPRTDPDDGQGAARAGDGTGVEEGGGGLGVEERMLEEDLERLLDEAMEDSGGPEPAPAPAPPPPPAPEAPLPAAAADAAAPAPAAADPGAAAAAQPEPRATQVDSAPATVREEESSKPVPAPGGGEDTSKPIPAGGDGEEPEALELLLEEMMDEEVVAPPSAAPPASASAPVPSQAASQGEVRATAGSTAAEEETLELALESLLDEDLSAPS